MTAADKPTRCEARSALTDAEIRALESLPEPVAHELQPVLQCELQREHSGEHVSLGQSGGDGSNWWLSWPTGVRALQPLPICPASAVEDGEDDPCTLPMGHDGAHDFEMYER